ncbi:MAG: hypothetical protein ACREGI_01205 [Candidatus Levyibacteriota bacterium]
MVTERVVDGSTVVVTLPTDFREGIGNERLLFRVSGGHFPNFEPFDPSETGETERTIDLAGSRVDGARQSLAVRNRLFEGITFQLANNIGSFATKQHAGPYTLTEAVFQQEIGELRNGLLENTLSAVGFFNRVMGERFSLEDLAGFPLDGTGTHPRYELLPSTVRNRYQEATLFCETRGQYNERSIRPTQLGNMVIGFSKAAGVLAA